MFAIAHAFEVRTMELRSGRCVAIAHAASGLARRASEPTSVVRLASRVRARNRASPAPRFSPSRRAAAQSALCPPPRSARSPSATPEDQRAIAGDGADGEPAVGFGAAEAHYRAALAREPAHRMARLNLGLSLHGRGQHDAAAEELELCLTHHPDSVDVRRRLVLSRAVPSVATWACTQNAPSAPPWPPTLVATGGACCDSNLCGAPRVTSLLTTRRDGGDLKPTNEHDDAARRA